MPALRARAPAWLLGAFLSIVTAWALTGGTRLTETESGAWLVLVLAVGLLALTAALALLLRLARGNWLHPLAFPVLYMTAVFVVPLLWVLGTGRPLGGIDPQLVSVGVLVVFVLTVAAFVTGVMLAPKGRTSDAPPAATNYVRMP